MSTTNGKEIAIIEGREIAQPEQPSPELLAMHAKSIGKFAESSVMELTPDQVKILQQPIPTEEILTRPDGMIYLDWGWYAGVLDQAFGAGHWSLTPAPWNPRLYREGNITYREYVMWVDGHFVANAIGHHEETRRTANFGDAAEATYANALTRCCKRLGVARDLWRKKRIEDLKKQMKTGKPSASPETIEVAKQHTGPESPLQTSSYPPLDSGPLPSYKELIDSIKAELLARWPSQNNADSAAKKAAIAKHFGGTWNHLIEMHSDDLARGLESLKCEPLEAK